MATSIVGKDPTETAASCLGCPQFDDGHGKRRCYAWTGLVQRAMHGVQRSGRAKDLPTVFSKAPDKRAVRLGAIGDPGRIDQATVTAQANWARRQGASVLAYTHHWRTMDWGKSLFMASCDTWQGARDALEQGWAPTVIVPQGTPKVVHTSTGHTFLRCPAESAPGRVTCGSCRLCSPDRLRATRWAGIMFVFHGSAAPWTPERRARHEARRLPVAP